METLTCLTSQTLFKQDTLKRTLLATDSYKGCTVSSFVLKPPIKYCYHALPCLHGLDRRGVQGPNDFSHVFEHVGKTWP